MWILHSQRFLKRFLANGMKGKKGDIMWLLLSCVQNRLLSKIVYFFHKKGRCIWGKLGGNIKKGMILRCTFRRNKIFSFNVNHSFDRSSETGGAEKNKTWAPFDFCRKYETKTCTCLSYMPFCPFLHLITTKCSWSWCRVLEVVGSEMFVC